MAKYKTFAEAVAAFMGHPDTPIEVKLTEEDHRKFDELEKKLEKLSPEERRELLTPKPGEIDDFII